MLLEGRVISTMGKMKQLVLFIVEGITDKVALEGVVSCMFDTSKTAIKITRGDITYDTSISVADIISQVCEHINNFCETEHYSSDNIEKIIHVIDTDGAFVNEKYIQPGENKKVKYFDDHIEIKNVDYMINRNKHKSVLVRKLFGTRKINDIPYQILFFSRNMEHLLHNEPNDLTDEQKMDLANEFADLFTENKEAFTTFINDNTFAVPGSYRETWDFIYKETNSLKRFSNFHLAFE